MLIRLYTLTVFILLMSNVSAAVEYYHCERGPDTYWKFDIDNIDSISPFDSPVVFRTTAGITMPPPIVKYNDEWFMVIMLGSGTYGVQMIYYINRKGKESWMRMGEGGPSSLGVCHDIQGEDLNTFFNLRSTEDEMKAREETFGF